MSYLEPVNDNGKKSSRARKPIKRKPTHTVSERETRERTARLSLVFGIIGFVTAGLGGIVGIVFGGQALKQIRAGKAAGLRYAVLGLVISVLAIIFNIGGGIMLNNAAHQQATQQTQLTHAQQVVKARQALITDVQQTTANVKTYLQENPRASIEQMQTKIVNRVIVPGETVTLVPLLDAKNAYKTWTVTGSAPVLGVSINYNYQSDTNTYRWNNNKTGAATNITVDKTARNSEAEKYLKEKGILK